MTKTHNDETWKVPSDRHPVVTGEPHHRYRADYEDAPVMSDRAADAILDLAALDMRMCGDA